VAGCRHSTRVKPLAEREREAYRPLSRGHGQHVHPTEQLLTPVDQVADPLRVDLATPGHGARDHLLHLADDVVALRDDRGKVALKPGVVLVVGRSRRRPSRFAGWRLRAAQPGR